MVIIPELQKVLLLVPRTGSTSLKNAVLNKYKNAMCIYRHMEADGIPNGYDRWEKVGVARHPTERLWSLFKFLKNFKGYETAYCEEQRLSVRGINFSDWIVNNRIVFTNPYDSSGMGGFWPYYNVLHSLPENQKSQFIYLRPDLGTTVYMFNSIRLLAKDLQLEIKHFNETPKEPAPELSEEANDHINRYFKWDLSCFGVS